MKPVKSMASRVNREIRQGKWDDDIKKMHEVLRKEGIGTPIMEVYSPARVNGLAARMGMVPGLSLDLTTNDPDDGQP